MPIGKRRWAGPAALPVPQPMPQGMARGFTYLGLLLLIAVSGAGLAALGSQWSHQLQRERERELRFRGGEIQAAVARYRQVSGPGLPRAWPQTLEDLLDDRRSGEPRHHLRRLYADPFTGRADWRLLSAPPPRPGAPALGFAGVRSRAPVQRLDEVSGPVSSTAPDAVMGSTTGANGGTTAAVGVRDNERTNGPAVGPRVSDWVFLHTEVAPAAPHVPPPRVNR
jgi:type II secretory pathway pseudopilin PulG